MIIDTHCHLDLIDFDPDRETVINKAKNLGIDKIVCPAIDLRSSQRVIELSQKYSGLYAAVGVQPEEIDQYYQEGKLKLDIQINLGKFAQNKKVVAIGECGLDYKHITQKFGRENRELINEEKEKQKDILRRQLGTAVLLNLPVIIHNREADEDVLVELSRYEETKRLRGVFHCFVGTIEFARRILDLGFLISLTGIITFPNAKALREVVEKLPLNKILVETDSPFLSPQKTRGQRNEPANIIELLEKIAQIKKLTFEAVARATFTNACDLFKI